MKTVPEEVSTAVFEMEDVIGSINAAVCTLKVMQDARINMSVADDAQAFCWVVGNLIADMRDLDRQWNALFRMTRETGGAGTASVTEAAQMRHRSVTDH